LPAWRPYTSSKCRLPAARPRARRASRKLIGCGSSAGALALGLSHQTSTAGPERNAGARRRDRRRRGILSPSAQGGLEVLTGRTRTVERASSERDGSGRAGRDAQSFCGRRTGGRRRDARGSCILPRRVSRDAWADAAKP
jgi:hypothetical protein